MPELEISLLGPFSVRIGEQPLEAFRSQTAAALLIVLAVEARALRREWLVELLWPEMPSGAGRKNLRQTLYELRQAIPDPAKQAIDSPQPFILADRQTIQLNEAVDYWVDTAEFSARLKTNNSDSLGQAVDLYQGDFLTDFYLPNSSAFEDWTAARRALYRRLALDAMDQLAQDALQRSNYEQAAGLARRQLGIDSLRETAVQQLMIALALTGRRNEALAQYEESRAELAQELGVEPEPATQAVYERIASGEIQPAGDDFLALLLPASEAPPRPPSPQPARETANSNLPADPTPFVGRTREVAAVGERLLDPSCRLLTLLGPGGCGKSRLAIRVARHFPLEWPETFPDGIWYAALTEAADANRLVSTMVQGLPFRAFDPASDLRAQLLSYLRGRQMLLLLDNMEYLQDPEGGRFLSALLDQAPGVTLLACSRTRLNLRAEQLFPLAGLDVPTDGNLSLEAIAGYSAVELFVNSARRVRPDFALTANAIPPILSICRQLQGIPLAIELAASWIEVMSPAEVDTEVKRCLDFLETGWVDVPERQRSLRTVFETSWRLLNGQERAAFLRLSVFRGGFDNAAAGRVADASQRTLLGLINKSWLQRDESGRYLAHEMLRQYAYQLLSDDDLAWESAHERHSAYFAELAYVQGELLKGPRQVTATERLDDEIENITAAWEWLVERERYETLLDRMLPGLFLYFAARSRGQRLVSLVTKAQHHLESSPTPDEPAWQVILLTVQAAFLNGFLISRYFITELYPPAEQALISAAYAIAHEHKLEDQLGIWSLMLAMLYGWAFDKTEAIAWLRRLVQSHRDGDPWLLAFTLENLGGLLMPSGLGRPEGQAGTAEADQYLEEAVSLFEKLGDRREKGYTLKLWGLLIRAGDFSDAKRILLDALRDLEIAGDPVMAIQIMGFLTDLCILRGEIGEGFEYSRRARQESARLGHDHFESGALSWESIWSLRLDTVEHARKSRKESLAVAKKAGDELNVAWGMWESGEIERVAGNYALARDLFDQARELFITFEEPYAPVFLERGLGDLSYDLGCYEESLNHFEESLRLATQVSHQWSAAYASFGMGRAALALARDGQEKQLSQSQAYIFDGLQNAYYHRYRDLYAIGVTELADCYTASGRVEEALRLTQVVLASPITWQETRNKAKQVQATILADRPELANQPDPDLPSIQSLMNELLETT
jgi:predicted ATPase/DNA-binding SARP family transcriptional activator